jgi:hypothetical protein
MIRPVMHIQPIQQKQEPTAGLVSAPAIARHIDVTPRYILQLAAEGKIPSVRIGRKCVRFAPHEVAKALGFSWEEGSK